MQHLPLPRSICEHVFTVRIISLLALLLSLPAVTTAASITYTYYEVYFTFPNNGNAAQVQIPIAGFDRSLGLFSAATIEMLVSVQGTVTFSCEAQGLEQRDRDCGRTIWEYDPVTGESIPVWRPWENPNYYVNTITSAEGFVFPQWDPPEPGSVPLFQDWYLSSSCCGGLGIRQFYGYAYLQSGLIRNSDLFSADTQLMFLSHVGAGASGYWVTSAALTNGHMDVTNRYDYAAVPEPDFKALTFLVLLSTWLVTILKRSGFVSTHRTTAVERR